MTEELFFDVSTGLKRVIGRDLITNDEVAVFELVKNSFDAGASLVQLYFSEHSLIVVDDGDGMSYEDLTDKWLFVAYSSKRPERAASDDEDNFRERIAKRKHYAGSKGIGRFSADRLGRSLILQTRTSPELSVGVHQLTVNWDLFESNDRQQFESVPIIYEHRSDFNLPAEIEKPKHGTAIEISESRIHWNREAILNLKSSLAKLINPFGASTDGFKISIISPEQNEADMALIDEAKESNEDIPENSIVNGEVGNFIFASLREKTTFIEVVLSQDGKSIVSSLTDRGELVYKISEPNPYANLVGSDFSCQLYYLNQSAKITFTKRMGLPSVQFGSVFLFRNGFRVFPIGEEGDDTFGIDRRKQQGYARFLGSRDIIGRVDVSGNEESFKEASSRNQGLVDSAAVRELRECFWEFCLKRLERYVVPVTWADSGEKTAEDLSRLLTDSGKARVTNAVARLIDNTDVEVLDYSKRLIALLNERSSQFEESITGLRSIALKTNDSELLSNLERAESRFTELKAAEAEAIRIANEERAAKESAQREAAEAQAAADQLSINLDEERKRSLFLASITSLDTSTIINMHHQITIYAGDLRQQIDNCLTAARTNGLSREETITRLEQVAFLSQKILSISRMATKANFRLESDTIEADLVDFMVSYIDEGATPFLGTRIDVSVIRNDALLVKKFRPMEVAVVVDNLISNSKKAGASEISFNFESSDKKTLYINVTDNGRGFPREVEDLDFLFGLGFSRTSGSGLGLYHIRQALSEMKGSITADSDYMDGAKFEIVVTA